MRRAGTAAAALNLMFIAGMVAFIHYFDRIDTYGPQGRHFIRFWLVQFHLGTENVVAAWYSSMLLLTVAAASAAAFLVDRRRPRQWLALGWLAFAAIFTLLSLDEIGSLHERIGMMVALNRASLLPESTTAVGWVYMFAVPIALVGAGMLAFAWLRLRNVPAALTLIAVGVGLYLMNPLLELAEGRLVHSGSANIIVERVLEEGIAELFGTTCFLLGVLIYLRDTAPDATLRVRKTTFAVAIAAGFVLMAAVIPVVHRLAGRLPAGDSGTPENWFPAAALWIVAGLTLTTRGPRLAAMACAALSAFFGADLFVYVLR